MSWHVSVPDVVALITYALANNRDTTRGYFVIGDGPIIGPKQALKPARIGSERASFNNPGDFLLSHAVTRVVPSAPTGLTSVFGMGTGVTLSTKSPENFFRFQFRISNLRFDDPRSREL